jgi:para-nitrobenzyl esterase
MQNAAGGGADQKVSEDCLYLNVWTSAKAASEKRPVMVWIYGGGYNVGSGSQPEYDGEALAKKGAVVVTINYRLGVFGFFSHPDLTRESDRRGAGNFDCWIRSQRPVGAEEHRGVRRDPKRSRFSANRLARIGRQPDGFAASQRMVVPVGESSSWTTATIGRLGNLSDAEQAGVKFADGIGAKSLADLRAKPAADVLKAGRGAGPIVDGWSIPEDPGTVFAQGKQNDAPVLVGSNRDESFGGTPANVALYTEQVRRRHGDGADSFLKAYPGATDEQAKDSAFIAGRDEMAWVMRNWARMEAATGSRSRKASSSRISLRTG